MFSIFSKKEKSITLNSADSFIVTEKETILKSALKQGVNFPYSCKVGGCAACKCQLVSGKVKQLTDAGYILSAEDLQNNYILACQSIPKTDVTLNVDLSAAAARQVSGVIFAQKKLTHDITQLDIRLEEPVRYKAGQYARITLKKFSDVSRPYSFASESQQDASLIRFFIREVPNGKISPLVNNENLIDEPVVIEAPMGDFYLQDPSSKSPLLFIAGGSGLAPVVALLQEALAYGGNRPVTLLFGARSQKDLYYLDEIGELEKQWDSTFVFSQVLSEEQENSEWTGSRGWVGDEIKRQPKADWEVYLCGPPAMIDQSMEQLALIGIPKSRMFADRFISEHQPLSN